MLGALSKLYFRAGEYDTSIIIDKNILDYWPNATSPLYRYSYVLMMKKRKDDALKAIQHLKKISPPGNYRGHIVELQLYQRTLQLDKYRQAFSNFISEDEKLLASLPYTYKALTLFSLHQKEFFKYTSDLYNKYKQYHPYNCNLENHLTDFFIRQKEYKKAREHVDIILNSENSTCLKQKFLNILKKQGL